MFVKKIQILLIFIFVQIIISDKQSKPNNNKPNNNKPNNNQPNNNKPNNTNQNTQNNKTNITGNKNVSNNLINETLLFPLENDTINITRINDTLIFYMNYNFNKKKFIRIILIILSSIIFLSIIYSFYKVPLKIGIPIQCCLRTKYIIKGFIFLIFFPLTSIYFLMNIVFSFIDGIFPDNNFEEERLEQTDVSMNKKKEKNLMKFNEEK